MSVMQSRVVMVYRLIRAAGMKAKCKNQFGIVQSTLTNSEGAVFSVGYGKTPADAMVHAIKARWNK